MDFLTAQGNTAPPANNTPEAFVYIWTDAGIFDDQYQTNKMYIGAHKGTANDGYVCSSIPMLAEYEQRPQDFTREIVMYGSWGSMLTVEADILQSVNAAANTCYYNQHNRTYKFGWGRPPLGLVVSLGTCHCRTGHRKARCRSQALVFVCSLGITPTLDVVL
jgi:hypothetical protein